MITCRKRYEDIPFAHRQHMHDGHCAWIHGHNWGIILTFGCSSTDENGFVVDFGKLKYIREWITEHLDHACLLNEDDPQKDYIIQSLEGMLKPMVVPSCSCEGLAQYLHGVFDRMVREETDGRAFVVEVEVTEDLRNSASYRP